VSQFIIVLALGVVFQAAMLDPPRTAQTLGILNRINVIAPNWLSNRG
jgi:hypothetical protein